MQIQISTYVDIRATYVAQTYLPLLHNFYPYAEQQPNRGHFAELYSFAPKAIQESAQSYIAFFAIPYSSIYHPYTYYGTIAQAHLFITRTSFPRKSESLG